MQRQQRHLCADGGGQRAPDRCLARERAADEDDCAAAAAAAADAAVAGKLLLRAP